MPDAEHSCEGSFVLFEADMLARRYANLKDRDQDAFQRQIKLFGFMILYGAAPFTMSRTPTPEFLQAWGVGGVWFVITLLFWCDRDFRAYGLHLKERVYCLAQLAVLRQIELTDNQEYLRHSLLPVGSFRRHRPFHGFPEYLSPGQVRTACYFFKFISLFPFVYLVVFSSSAFFPFELSETSTGVTSRMAFALAPAAWIWLYLSGKRALDLQRMVFEARRINSQNPWPVFEKEVLWGLIRSAKSYRTFKILQLGCLTATILCTLLFGYRLFFGRFVGGPWTITEIELSAATAVLLAGNFVAIDLFLTEILRSMKERFATVASAGKPFIGPENSLAGDKEVGFDE